MLGALTQCAALVPAAGSGSRLGEPKATLLIGGIPLLERQVRLLRAAGVQPIVAVVAADQPASVALAQRLQCITVLNEQTHLGQSHSVRLGAQALPEGPFLLLPVDCAWTRLQDVQALLLAHAAAQHEPDMILRPHHGTNYGHPVLFGADYRSAFIALPADQSAATVYRTHRIRVQLVPVDNTHIHEDVDTPEDLERCVRTLEG